MSGFLEGAKKIVNQCANCNHAEFLHLRSRNTRRLTVEPSECTECKKIGKSCKSFKAK